MPKKRTNSDPLGVCNNTPPPIANCFFADFSEPGLVKLSFETETSKKHHDSKFSIQIDELIRTKLKGILKESIEKTFTAKDFCTEMIKIKNSSSYEISLYSSKYFLLIEITDYLKDNYPEEFSKAYLKNASLTQILNLPSTPNTNNLTFKANLYCAFGLGFLSGGIYSPEFTTVDGELTFAGEKPIVTMSSALIVPLLAIVSERINSSLSLA